MIGSGSITDPFSLTGASSCQSQLLNTCYYKAAASAIQHSSAISPSLGLSADRLPSPARRGRAAVVDGTVATAMHNQNCLWAAGPRSSNVHVSSQDTRAQDDDEGCAPAISKPWALRCQGCSRLHFGRLTSDDEGSGEPLTTIGPNSSCVLGRRWAFCFLLLPLLNFASWRCSLPPPPTSDLPRSPRGACPLL